MRLSRLNKDLVSWLRLKWRRPDRDEDPSRGPVTHVVILDGTMSSLEPDMATNAGRAYHLLRDSSDDISLYYEPGLQWADWRGARDVVLGRGINRQIMRAYGFLARRYHPGDRIFLMGYSRGAYAVRSLAGVIDRIGLLRSEVATERNIREAYQHYREAPSSAAAHAFHTRNCLPQVNIDMIGVWDTVKSLGLNMPLLWRFSAPHHAFHNHALSANVCNGFQALAHDETRVNFAPVLWDHPRHWQGQLEQVWFPGSHGDIGGQLGGFEAARPLANIPFVWMMERAETCGLPLRAGWQQDHIQDPLALSVGNWRSFGKLFMTRRKRIIGRDRSERIHESVHIRGTHKTPGRQVRFVGRKTA